MRKVRAARQLAISTKRFDGWEPAEVTTHEYDDATGRVIRSTTTREVEWDAGERAWMLALAYYEAQLCQRCGLPLHETLDPDRNPDDPKATHPYVADDPVTCLHCLVLTRSERKWAKIDEDGHQALIHSAKSISRKPRIPKRKGQVNRADSASQTPIADSGIHRPARPGAGGDGQVRQGLNGQPARVQPRGRQGRPR